MGNYTIFYMFENPRRGRQPRNFSTNVSKILDLKSSSEQIIFRKLSLGAPVAWAVTLSRWPCLLHPSFISQMEGDVKERTLMFEKTRKSFPGDVVLLSRIIHIMGCGWVTESS